MSYYLFYKYKPVTIFYLIVFIGLLFGTSALEMTVYPYGSIYFALFFRVMAFAIWYPSFLFYFYILKNSDNIKIQGISPSCLKSPMKLIFFLNLTIIFFITLIFALVFRNYVDVSWGISFFMFCLSIFGVKKTENFLVATLISQGKKEQIDTRNINADYLYETTKEVLLKQSAS